MRPRGRAEESNRCSASDKFFNTFAARARCRARWRLKVSRCGAEYCTSPANEPLDQSSAFIISLMTLSFGMVLCKSRRALCGLSWMLSRMFGRVCPSDARASFYCSMRPASCSSGAPSATKTSTRANAASRHGFCRGRYIEACVRRLVAISRMLPSTASARCCAPECLPARTMRMMPEKRSRRGPQATYRVKRSGPRVDASWTRLTQTALASIARSTSRCASYRHHAIVVYFR
jgi:hypothetical protein